MSDLQKIVDARNAKLAKRNAPRKVRGSGGKVTEAQFNKAFGPAPAYMQDACKVASDRAALMLARRGS